MDTMKVAPLESCRTCLYSQCSASEINKIYALNSALDHAYSVLRIGLIFFDSDRALTHINEHARIKLKLPKNFLLMGEDPISKCFDHQSQTNLRNAIDQLINNKGINDIHLNVSIGNNENAVMLQRLENTAFGINAPEVVLFIFESQPDNNISSTDVARIFGLTKTEARLTLAIANGMTATEYSQKYGVSINTVYSQVKEVLAKTGTRRQAELVKLVLEHSPNLERRKNNIPVVIERRKPTSNS